MDNSAATTAQAAETLAQIWFLESASGPLGAGAGVCTVVDESAVVDDGFASKTKADFKTRHY